MKQYDHKKIEPKWQKYWEKKKINYASDPSTRAKLGTGQAEQKKFYALIEFPYPSGDGLHVGHPRPYIGMDVISRKKRMEGFNVLYPIGWDAFGLPTENYAIKTGQDPRFVTKKNSDTFRRQIKSIGISFDWSREINTTDPKYYKWTQWIFLQLLKKGLAYKSKSFINWCVDCKIGLANEEVINGKCERCGGDTEKREKEQWMLAITKYADRLDKDLDLVDYPDRVKIQQRNWIGKSEGAEIEFEIRIAEQTLKNSPALPASGLRQGSNFSVSAPQPVKVFTTRPDTIFGATYMVLAPEHELIEKIKLRITNLNEVEKYIKEVKKKTEIDRTDENKEKTGVEIKGVKAINPATKEEIPIWIADYVLATYGTGAIMAVPADDERDREFAEKFKLPIMENYKKAGLEDFGKKVTTFKLRDWVFSRQRYWGEPIPVVKCLKCGWVPVPERDLPVELPKVKNYQPTESGESPLMNISKWVNVKCPKCKGRARRETDTMPNWAGSSWYFLRYVDHKNNKKFADAKNLKYWMPIDWYNGGMEHTTLHLLYSRFWHKFLYDMKLVPGTEPYKKRTSHGMILAAGGEKMSKSRGNVINPDKIVKIYGADTLRVYEMFMGPFEQAIEWSDEAIIGPRRFLEKVWRMGQKVIAPRTQRNSAALPASRLRHGQNFYVSATQAGSDATQKYSLATLQKLLHKTIKKVSEDIEEMRFNTAISALMIFTNEAEKFDFIPSDVYEKFLQILSPFAPHISEEMWSSLGHKNSILLSEWPKYDKNLIKDEEMKIAVQINGKVRAEMLISADEKEENVKNQVLQNQAVIKYVAGKEIKKIIYVKNRLVNIVI